MFDREDGWCFERTAEGEVRLFKKLTAQDNGVLVVELYVTSDEWSSMITSPMKSGEKAEIPAAAITDPVVELLEVVEGET